MKSLILVGLLLLLLLSACKPSTSNQRAADSGAGANPLENQVVFKSDWDKLLAGARKEGTVVLQSTAGAETRVLLLPAFKERFGISIDYVSGKGAEVAQKILTERRAGIYTSDVYMGGTTTLFSQLKPAGVIEPLKPVLLLPELTNPQAWYGGELRWLDKDQTILSLTGSPSGRIAVNSNMVRADEIASWKDMLNPKWKGKISINDPTAAGAGAKAFGVLVEVLGVEFMRDLMRQEPAVVRDQRMQVEWVAQGKYPIAIAPKSDPVAEFANAGAPIKIVTPKDGLFLTSGSGNIALINKAPHPQAARVFINWLLTKEGQTLFTQAQRTHSLRLDVPTSHVEPDRLREEGIKYFIEADNEDFEKKLATEYRELALSLFGGLVR